MKNLFVVHTQYNLILAMGIASRYKNEENTLVVFAEFNMDAKMKEKLSKSFSSLIVIRDHFEPLRSSVFAEVKYQRECIKKLKDIWNESFDNVFMSQDRLFSMALRHRTKKMNPKRKCYNIEEDAYYSLNNKYNIEDCSIYNTKAAQKFRKKVALAMIGYPYNYKEYTYCYGMSEDYDGAYLLFPQLARREMAGRELHEITRQEIAYGIEKIYSECEIELPEANRYMVMFFDLMERYKNQDSVKQIIETVVKQCSEKGILVLAKYHPRETRKFTGFEDMVEVPQNIPAEKLLAELQGKDVVVFGNATTSCIVAAKFGYKVISICKIEVAENKAMHTKMEQMGVVCISDTSEIKL